LFLFSFLIKNVIDPPLTSIESVMTKNVVAARSNTPVTEVISLMVKFNVGTIPIVDSTTIPVGIITDGDVVREAALGKGISPLVNTGDIISASYITMSPETAVKDAAREMLSKRARILVTNRKSGALEGIVTTTDLLRVFSNILEDKPLTKFFTSNVKTLDVHASLKDAIELMFTKKLGSVILTTDGMPSAIVTERGLLGILNKNRNLNSITLDEVATKPLITAAFGVTVKEATSIMLEKGIKRLPLMKGEKLVGITTALDLVSAFLSKVEIRVTR